MKKLICFALVAVLLLSTFAIGVSATEPTYGYDATLVGAVDLAEVPDIKELALASEPYYNAAGYAEGLVWKITDAEGMKLFSLICNADAANNFFEKTVYLANDIDMAGVTDFKPIGNDTTHGVGAVLDGAPVFRGTFDGQGHSIKNLVMTSAADGVVNVALFGGIRGCTIRNLVIDATCSFTYTGKSTGARVGAVAAYSFAHGGDKHVALEKPEDPNSCIPYQIINVQNNANVKSSAGYAGGIIGVAAGATGYMPYITNCSNTGKVEGITAAGGIVGALYTRKMTMINCLNTGDITAKYMAAGLMVNQVPDTNPTVIKNCKAACKVTGSEVAKLVFDADNNNVTATDCVDTDVTTAVVEVQAYYGFGTTELTYTGTVGYSAERVTKVDLSEVLPICTFLDADASVTTFKISTPTDLSYFAMVVNSGANMQGYTIYLENDINMAGVTMNPIGSSGDAVFGDKNSSLHFSGTFDGQGHVIDNLVINHTAGTGDEMNLVGLFGMVRSGVVKNVVLGSGCSFSYTGEGKGIVAGIAAMSYRLNPAEQTCPVFDNCYSAATVTSNKGAAGIVYYFEGNNNNHWHTVSNCTNAGAVSGGEYAGGIGGYISNRRIEVTNCRNTGKVTLTAETASTSSGAAGIFARPNTNLAMLVKGCINNGEIAGPGTIGGIVAIENNASVLIEDCSNYGVLNAPSGAANVGPIYGQCTLLNYDHMQNNADVRSATDATLSTLPTITPNFPSYAEIDDAHSKIFGEVEDGGDTTEEPDENDNKPAVTTQAPTTTTAPTATQAPGTTEDPADEKKGCGAALAGSALALILTVSLCGAALCKKKN